MTTDTPTSLHTAIAPRATRRAAVPVLGAMLLAGCGGASAAPFDQQFIDMMVPHHQAALEMAKVAQQRAQRPQIKGMAADILRTQDAEIELMKQWRRAWYGSDRTPPLSRMPMVPGMTGQGHGGGAGHSGGSGGTMDMAADVERLRKAAEPFDRAFIDEMIPHHESAINAARAAETRAQKQEIKDLAKQIIADQQREIEQMRAWRREWFG